MRSHRPAEALLGEIRESIAQIESYVRGIELLDFSADPMRRDATAFRLLIIGEVAQRLPDEVRTGLPDVDWRGIISLRHRLAHDYPSADTRVLWTIAQQDVPALSAALDRL